MQAAVARTIKAGNICGEIRCLLAGSIWCAKEFDRTPALTANAAKIAVICEALMPGTATTPQTYVRKQNGHKKE
jgi:hypothetical protein